MGKGKGGGGGSKGNGGNWPTKNGTSNSSGGVRGNNPPTAPQGGKK